MTSSIKCSLNQLRKALIQNQFIFEGSTTDANAGHLIQSVLDRLGYVQLDTIHVIERAHHHTLWNRIPEYDKQWLHQAQAVDRQVFEYWGHAMSLMPMSDFRFCLPRMEHFKAPASPWAVRQHEACKHILDDVLNRIKAEGPLGAKDFKDTRADKSGWWDWKPAKIALELLLWQGRLMVKERAGFNKVYDLTERVLPSWVDTTMPTEDEIARFLIIRSLKAMVAANEYQILRFMQPGSARDNDWQAVSWKIVKKTLNEMLEAGTICAVEVEGFNGKSYYMLPAMYESIEKACDTDSVKMLSPFDNLLIQRKRCTEIFGFDYMLECYVPEKKRVYGYFVLPVLQGSRFVARTDLKAERKSETLLINSFYIENTLTPSDLNTDKLVSEIKRFARFNGCHEVAAPSASVRRSLPSEVLGNVG